MGLDFTFVVFLNFESVRKSCAHMRHFNQADVCDTTERINFLQGPTNNQFCSLFSRALFDAPAQIFQVRLLPALSTIGLAKLVLSPSWLVTALLLRLSAQLTTANNLFSDLIVHNIFNTHPAVQVVLCIERLNFLKIFTEMEIAIQFFSFLLFNLMKLMFLLFCLIESF